MADLLWQKPGVAVDAQIQTFLAGDDVILDREFFLHDIAASAAHAQGLQHIGILSADELEGLLRELEILAQDFREGRFVLDTQYEDGHSAIEARLTERLGDAGRKIHTGRSRNDQILVATRLWLKEKLQRVAQLSAEVAKVALDRAQAEKDLPVPGYTHIQRAVVSSAGMWWAGWAEAFIDNAIRARDTHALVDANPLGTAAGYGVNLPLDREHTTAALGFARMQISPIYAQLSRGKFELAALELLPALLANLEWRDDRLRAAIDSGMYATDVAVEAAVAGVPFREAYKAAAAGADSAGQGRTPEGSLAARVSPGSAADLRLDELRARWQALS